MKLLLLLSLFLLPLSKVFSTETIILTESNHYTFRDVVNQMSVSKAIDSFQSMLDNEEETIYLILDTPGGSVFDGLDFINFLVTYPKQVKTITFFSASMGFQIVQANPGKRLVTSTGVLMSHPISGGFQGEIGDGLDIKNRMKAIEEVAKVLDLTTVFRTNNIKTLESYKNEYMNELWITGQSAVDNGYADEVVNVGCDKSLAGSFSVTSVKPYFNTTVEITQEYSKCPLASGVLRYKISISENGTRKIVAAQGYPNYSNNLSDIQDPQLKRELENLIKGLLLSNREKLDLIKKGKL